MEISSPKEEPKRSIPWVLFVLGAFILGVLLGYYLGTQRVGSGLIPEGERSPSLPLEDKN